MAKWECLSEKLTRQAHVNRCHVVQSFRHDSCCYLLLSTIITDKPRGEVSTIYQIQLETLHCRRLKSVLIKLGQLPWHLGGLYVRSCSHF